MKLFVLAGGFGTRLKPLTGNQPKALVSINGKPLLEIQIHNWIGAGFTQFYFLLYYGSSAVIDCVERAVKGLSEVKEVLFIVEPTPLGTGGAVINGLRETGISGVFYITNADTWIDSDLAELIQQQPPAIAVCEVDDVTRFGAVKLGANNVVTNFEEKQKYNGRGMVYAGLTKMDTDLLRSFSCEESSLEKDIFPFLCDMGVLSGVILNGPVVDIGVPESLTAFRSSVIV